MIKDKRFIEELAKEIKKEFEEKTLKKVDERIAKLNKQLTEEQKKLAQLFDF